MRNAFSVNVFTVLAFVVGQRHKTIDLQSIKQLLCQTGKSHQKDDLNAIKTISYTYSLGARRSGDMSSQCRRLRTGNVPREAK
jgi:hypothetical protein